MPLDKFGYEEEDENSQHKLGSAMNLLRGSNEYDRYKIPASTLQSPPAQLQHQHPYVAVSTCLDPAGVFKKLVGYGEAKAKLSWWKTLWLGIYAGIFIGLGDVLVETVGMQVPALKAANPGLAKLLVGSFGLPFGLTMVVLTGAELFTSNTTYLSTAFYEGKISLWAVIRNWSISWGGNLLGGLILSGWMRGTELFETPGVAHNAATDISQYKTSHDFGVTFLRGVLCNWCVNIAVWQATMSNDVAGKVLGIFWPIMAFVTIGFEHSVANMYFIPFGMMMDSHVSVAELIWKNLFPATLGNIVAGALAVGFAYSCIYGTFALTAEKWFKQFYQRKLSRFRAAQSAPVGRAPLPTMES